MILMCQLRCKDYSEQANTDDWIESFKKKLGQSHCLRHRKNKKPDKASQKGRLLLTNETETSSNVLNDHTSNTNKASPTTATTTAMAQLPPEDIATEPTQKVVFNAPFDKMATAWVVVRLGVVTNPGTKRIGYAFNTKRIGSAFKTTKPKRLNVIPPNGTLGAKKSVKVAITCDAFNPDGEDTEGDRVTVKWTNTPDPAATVFKPEWFQGDGIVRRKNLAIEYNV
ncbi:hypothetical protein niasHS_016862 [Heterodera schachtii]|uniref:Major sperm protein n=1 Tax=Heterodera schachtii TaxID=97005 RepID=A0ABD2HUW2_HETSC